MKITNGKELKGKVYSNVVVSDDSIKEFGQILKSKCGKYILMYEYEDFEFIDLYYKWLEQYLTISQLSYSDKPFKQILEETESDLYQTMSFDSYAIKLADGFDVIDFDQDGINRSFLINLEETKSDGSKIVSVEHYEDGVVFIFKKELNFIKPKPVFRISSLITKDGKEVIIGE